MRRSCFSRALDRPKRRRAGRSIACIPKSEWFRNMKSRSMSVLCCGDPTIRAGSIALWRKGQTKAQGQRPAAGAECRQRHQRTFQRPTAKRQLVIRCAQRAQHMARSPQPMLKIRPIGGQTQRQTQSAISRVGRRGSGFQCGRQQATQIVRRCTARPPRRTPQRQQKVTRQFDSDGNVLCHSRRVGDSA